jgi:hypothetical protein
MIFVRQLQQRGVQTIQPPRVAKEVLLVKRSRSDQIRAIRAQPVQGRVRPIDFGVRRHDAALAIVTSKSADT